MQPLIQRLLSNNSNSFLARTFRTPHFEVGWHQHIEYELILFTEGSGISFIGNHVGEFETGDIYFIGSNLPHTFQKNGNQVASAVVVQFREDFWGKDFMQIPENRELKNLFDSSILGMKINRECKQLLTPIIKELEYAEGVKRILLLLEALSLLATKKDNIILSTQIAKEYNKKDMDVLDKIIQFTISSYREQISLSDTAKIACMSVPSFCRNFKQRTKKTYNGFLNEIRIANACNLLSETNKPVLEICYESGYTTLANFHKQFLKIKNITPLQYRKLFSPENIRKGTNIGINEVK
ncbi:AraC family transcriptional regulator [Flavobacterium gilvum]|uniref:AraC family transcriptional regulator n=1 Tax=Flavobacterium gilvum TaxID=1492737 RepID=A0AAC9I6X7_9FLAO|nr:AraC family transcriptional regulator [Flavobacterium gilvum]AOW10792.1 AraC family transcriptional regulator [Flavobacterium gilvum]KFC59945.1 hypothetical protein FEM08_12490 [Flavobacterium gilvum]